MQAVMDQIALGRAVLADDHGARNQMDVDTVEVAEVACGDPRDLNWGAIDCPPSSQPAPARAFGKGIECDDDLWRAPDAVAWARAGFDDDACLRQGFEVSARVL